MTVAVQRVRLNAYRQDEPGCVGRNLAESKVGVLDRGPGVLTDREKVALDPGIQSCVRALVRRHAQMLVGQDLEPADRARARTGTSPAADTRLGSSNTAEVARRMARLHLREPVVLVVVLQKAELPST